MLTYNNPADETKSLKSYSRMFDAECVLETNKKIVFRCPDKAEARNFLFNLNNQGYAVEMKRGLKSSYWYVAAYCH